MFFEILVNIIYSGHVAQLARAFDLHSKGHGFESHRVHNRSGKQMTAETWQTEICGAGP